MKTSLQLKWRGAAKVSEILKTRNVIEEEKTHGEEKGES
jgi:hypothetical protein